MGATLIAHSGSIVVPRERVLSSATPAGTKTHKPVAHGEVIQEVLDGIAARGLTIKSERFSLSAGDKRMFAVFDIAPDPTLGLPEDIGAAIGARNSHNKSLALGLCGGARVFVCDNLMFNGDVIHYRKHTAGIDAKSAVQKALDAVLTAITGEVQWMVSLRDRKIQASAEHVVVEAFRKGALSAKQLAAVIRHFFNGMPGRAASGGEIKYNDGTAWGLYQSCTEVFKGQQPASILKRCRRLNQIFRSQFPGPDGK